LTRDETSVQPQNLAVALDDIVSGKISLHPGWRKDIWAKSPGAETIEELLAILEGVRLSKDQTPRTRKVDYELARANQCGSECVPW
jgi:hypothetical protein